MFSLLSFLLISMPGGAATLNADALFYDALVARVGREAVLVSDLKRYEEIDGVMVCAGLRPLATKKSDTTADQVSLYVEEELIYQDARTKKVSTTKLIPDAIAAIRSKPSCQKNWQSLGRRYSKLWATPNRPLEGESMLVLELEKRLLVDRYLKENAISDRTVWVREAKVKTQVKLYLD